MEAESMIGVGLAAGLGFVLYSLLFKEPEIADTTQLDKFNQKVARGELNFNKQPKAKQQAKAKAPVFIETKDVPEQQQQPSKKKSKEAASPLSPYADPVKKTFAVSKQEKAKQVNKGFEVVTKKSKEVSASEKKKRAQLNKLEKELEKVREADKAARDIEFAERRALRERLDAEKKEKAEAEAAKAAEEAEEAEAKDGKKVDAKAASAAELASKEAKAAQAAKAEKTANDKIKEILDGQKREKAEKAKAKLVKGVARNANPKPVAKPVAKPEAEEGEGSDNNSGSDNEGEASPAAVEERGWNSVSKAEDFTSVLGSEADENVSRRMAPAAFPELK